MRWARSTGTALRGGLNKSAINALTLNQGTIYASLVRLQQRGWISASWGVSDNNRKAKFYELTKAGRKQLAAEIQSWERTSAIIGRMLRLHGVAGYVTWIRSFGFEALRRGAAARADR